VGAEIDLKAADARAALAFAAAVADCTGQVELATQTEALAGLIGRKG